MMRHVGLQWPGLFWLQGLPEICLKIGAGGSVLLSGSTLHFFYQHVNFF